MSEAGRQAPMRESGSLQMNDLRASLEYYTQKNCAEQWRVFVSEMMSEFYVQVDRELAESFLTRVGTRVAQALPLRPCESLEDVAADLNSILTVIEWGWVRIEETGQHIRIVHGAYPVVPMYDNAPEHWLVPVLEGAYTEWLNSMGGDPTLRAVQVGRPRNTGEPLEFFYGKH